MCGDGSRRLRPEEARVTSGGVLRPITSTMATTWVQTSKRRQRRTDALAPRRAAAGAPLNAPSRCTGR
jgi:hypothetical protein